MNFDKIIKEARDKGMSYEDIAETFTKELNSVEEKDKRGSDTQTYKDIAKDFYSHFKLTPMTYKPTYEDAANLYIIAAIGNENCKARDEDTDELASRKKSIAEMFSEYDPLSTLAEKVCKSTKYLPDPSEVIRNFVNSL